MPVESSEPPKLKFRNYTTTDESLKEFEKHRVHTNENTVETIIKDHEEQVVEESKELTEKIDIVCPKCTFIFAASNNP